MNGELSAFVDTVRKDGQLGRMKMVGIVSHLNSQRSALEQWLRASPISHMLLIRTTDDTNVVVGSQTEKLADEGSSDNEAEDLPSTTKVRSKRRVVPLLGMIQEVSVRRTDCLDSVDKLESVRLHAPSLVLPKVTWRPFLQLNGCGY